MTQNYSFETKINFEPNAHYRFGKPLKKRVLVTLRGLSMGGQYKVRAIVDADSDFEVLNANIKQTLDIVENQMSIFKPDSALVQFNRYPMDKWFSLPPGTADNFEIALEIGRLSDGALDITLAPLIELWGFGKNGQTDCVPHADQLTAMQMLVGHRHLKFDKAGRRILKTANCQVSLNAIAKGYAVDLVNEFLKSQNIVDFMVEVAGEVVTSGRKPDGAKWRLAIEMPLSGVTENQQIVELSDMAIATSGDYRKYFEQDGVRFSHVIDPKTLRPIEHRLASVTVVEPQSARADALATAILVMGEVDGLQFAMQHKLAVHFIIKRGDGFEVVSTEKMQKYFSV